MRGRKAGLISAAAVGAILAAFAGAAAADRDARPLVASEAASPPQPTTPDETTDVEAPDGLRRFVADQSARLHTEAPAIPLINQSSTQHLSSQAVLALASSCAPATPATALVSIAQVESGFSPWAVRVNGVHAQRLDLPSQAEATAQAQRLIHQGRSVDLGLAQINSRNLAWLGLSVRDAFDPCRNLAAAARILDHGYQAALGVDRANRPLLQMAYSIYNTGGAEGGWRNGYVAKIETARRSLPR